MKKILLGSLLLSTLAFGQLNLKAIYKAQNDKGVTSEITEKINLIIYVNK